MKHKHASQYASIAASRMIIRQCLSWQRKIVFSAVAVGLCGAFVMWTYEARRNFVGISPDSVAQQVHLLGQQVKTLEAERNQFSTIVNATESQLNIERSTQAQLLSQIKGLETENIQLKEDLAFFEKLLPTNLGTTGISIERLRAELIAPNQLRYQLLAIRGQKLSNTFVGALQFSVAFLQNGKVATLDFPEQNAADDARYKLTFKYYQRVEGILNLPDDVTVTTLQAKVFEKGQLRTQKSVNL